MIARDGAASATVPTIDLLVVQPTPFCNIDCRYCYLPERSSKAVVASQTLHNLFSQVFASGWVEGGLSVVWHAGEPMVLPIAFYRDAFAMVERLRPHDVTVVHSFQTNGTLIDDAWCAFFAEERVNLGVSIDGPKHLHDRNRVTRSGRGTFDRTIAGIRLLRRHGIPFHVISVLSSASLAAPGEMFDFYVEEGIERICFNVEESEGDHVSRSFADGAVEAAYYRFLSEFWRLSAAAPGKIVFLREIEQALQQIIRPKEAEFRNQLVEPFAITSMDWAGNISTFSPELLGLKNPAYDDFVLGNINRDALVDLQHGSTLARMRADIDAGVAMCRERCEYFSVCGGGEPVNKLAENGSFTSTETTYCRLTRMRATDLVLDALERVAPDGFEAPGIPSGPGPDGRLAERPVISG
ncbi:MAG TPA: cyclophane-forming radical SAM/SPASM peptide maturase GrrM/OscB [Stellaceae bacterium]